MGRPPSIPVEKKSRIVLSVLAGEMSIAEAARREVSEQSIGRWKAEFLEAGKTITETTGLPGGAQLHASPGSEAAEPVTPFTAYYVYARRSDNGDWLQVALQIGEALASEHAVVVERGGGERGLERLLCERGPSELQSKATLPIVGTLHERG